MMRRKEYFRKSFLIFFCFLSLILSFGLVKTAHASVIDGIDDGITNWIPASQNQVGLKDLGHGLHLGYTFGLASDLNLNVTNGSDGTITKDSTAVGGNNLYYSKFNVFLKTPAGTYVPTTMQGGLTGTSLTVAADQVSLSSPDFLIAPTNDSTGDGALGLKTQEYALLSNAKVGNVTNSFTNKKFYIGSDANNNPAYKIVGDFNRTDTGGKNIWGTYKNLKAELLIRISPGNAPVVQRELYIRNNDTTTQSFGVLFGEDTSFGTAKGYENDSVPIYDLGNKSGLYIENQRVHTTDPSYKLMITNKLKDGPTSYVGQKMASPQNWLTGFSGSKFSGTGDESKGYSYGSMITGGNVDSAYTQKWDYTTLAPGKIAHYATAIGATESPYALPVPNKSFTNETSTDGKNHVGDTLKFSLNIINYGFQSSWGYKQLVDKIPDGLQIKPGSIKMTSANGTTSSIPDDDYDSSTKTLTIPMANESITDGKENTVTFETIIASSASSQTLTNTGEFTGTDNATGSNSDTYKASVDIPIEKSAFTYNFTHYLKNETTGETTYGTSTKAKAGDIIDYETTFTVPSDSTDYYQSGTLTNPIPDGLEKVTATMTGSDNNTYNINPNIPQGISYIKRGNSIKMNVRAKVTKATAGIISSTALITGTTSSGASTGDIVSNEADVNISDVVGFTETPSLINFGSLNFTGQEESLTNVATTGQLIVNHPTDNNYTVSVAYDNDNATTQMRNSDGDTLSPTSDGLIFIKSRTSSPDDKGTWMPITPSGTPIQTSTFNGTQNLTNYIGVGDWKLNINSNTKPGAYNGTLTWSMADSI
ncbi:hypothetical protein [Companilactobacillus jidongensis]|uniref:hypothetical protein n=1 Tax=Companilactobacillus jidongensis TaxID=2486006 RepID=UPI0013DE5461|nr:hypothetical protein [Companilactobacillus jidongensis]